MAFQQTEFLHSLQNPATSYNLSLSLVTLLFNGIYDFENPFSILKNIFPAVENIEDVRGVLISINSDLADEICNLIEGSTQIDKLFISDIENIIYPYI